MIERNYNVPEKTNLIINDTRIPTEKVREIFAGSESAKVAFDVLDTYELTVPLELALINFIATINQEKPCDLTPRVRGQIGCPKLEDNTLDLINSVGYSTYTNTRREWLDQGRSLKPVIKDAGIPTELVERINDREVSQIAIIDDVVSSGQTIQCMKTATEYKLYENLPYEDNPCREIGRFGLSTGTKIPKVGFFVFTWLLQKSADTGGFKVEATSVYGRKSGKVPVNSLSTLNYENRKGREVCDRYSVKYFNNPNELEKILSDLRK